MGMSHGLIGVFQYAKPLQTRRKSVHIKLSGSYIGEGALCNHVRCSVSHLTLFDRLDSAGHIFRAKCKKKKESPPRDLPQGIAKRTGGSSGSKEDEVRRAILGVRTCTEAGTTATE